MRVINESIPYTHIRMVLFVWKTLIHMAILQFFHSPLAGHWGCLGFGAITNETSMNMCAQVFLWIYVFSSGE